MHAMNVGGGMAFQDGMDHEFLVLIAAGGDNLAARVGNAFCTANITSTTAENDKVYYRNEYDNLANRP
jgi:hypothetical protein